MKNKVILICIDGMRSDALKECEYIKTMVKTGKYCLNAKSVNPPVTLPAHLSMFYGVSPNRHGVTTNTFVPFSHPLRGIFEKVHDSGGTTAFYYGWDQLKAIAPGGSLFYSTYIDSYSEDSADTYLTDRAIEQITRKQPDFVFLYLVDTDESGHGSGWMSETYMSHVQTALKNVKRMIETFGSEYEIILTADHGGHDKGHGEDIPEDMTVPMFYFGRNFKKGEKFENGSIMDIAPTVAKLMGLSTEREWEGVAR